VSKLDISNRGKAMPSSPIRKLIPYSDQAKKRGIHVYHLNIGQPDIETPPEFWNAIKDYSNKVLAYGNSQGLTPYLDKLAGYYQKLGLDVNADDIIVTTGGSEAIIFAMTIICEPGDEIIVFEPFYTNYNGFAVQTNVNLVPVTTNADNGFHFPPDAIIEKAITDKTKGILYCNPNNPTGTVYTRDELIRLKNIAIRHNLYLLADEVYREFIYEGEHISIMSFKDVSDQSIMLDSISKRYSACGARVGNIVSKNRNIYQAALRLGQARLCSPTLEQVGAAAVYALGADYFKKTMEEYQRRRDVVYEALLNIKGAVCLKPNGAFYAMAKLPIDDAEKFSQFMLTDFDYQKKTVLVAPGPGFYASPNMGTDECRIAYVLNTTDLKDAMDILKRGIEAYNSR
jgi:aspartate aminotransferase